MSFTFRQFKLVSYSRLYNSYYLICVFSVVLIINNLVNWVKFEPCIELNYCFKFMLVVLNYLTTDDLYGFFDTPDSVV